MGLNHEVQVIQYSPKWFLKGVMEVSKINREDHKSKLFDYAVANAVHR